MSSIKYNNYNAQQFRYLYQQFVEFLQTTIKIKRLDLYCELNVCLFVSYLPFNYISWVI